MIEGVYMNVRGADHQPADVHWDEVGLGTGDRDVVGSKDVVDDDLHDAGKADEDDGC